MATSNRMRKRSPQEGEEAENGIPLYGGDKQSAVTLPWWKPKRNLVLAALGSLFVLYYLAGGKDKESLYQQQAKESYSSSPSSSSSSLSSQASNLRNNKKLQNTGQSSPDCTVWIAPSSIIGHAGYGIYTTRDLRPGDSIIGYADGLSISVAALPPPDKPWHALWGEYWWRQNLPDHSSYEAPNHIFDFIVGLGTYPNHHCVLGSLTYRYAKPYYDDELINRFVDPGTGAFSYNIGKEPLVHKNVTAGKEIFLNYGYCDRESGHQPEWSQFIVMDRDFDDARRMIRTYVQGRHDEMDYDTQGKLVVYKKAVSLYTYDLLPKTKQEFDQFMVGTNEENLRQRVGERSLHPRSVQWIQENGMCMMNMIPKKSTIPSAGRGAFAQFALKKGSIISPMPLLQLIDPKFDTKEILVNYCFRHTHSSMMLCPMSSAALINHCSSRQRTESCPKGPNAAIRWASSDWDATTAAWRQMTLTELALEHERGLSFEVYALRDIQPGEEIMFDYGIEWEAAWNKHVQLWKPPAKVNGFVTAKQANDNEETILDEFISGDLRKTVDHASLFTGCQYYLDENSEEYHVDGDGGGDDEYYTRRRLVEDNEWTKLSDEKILEQFAQDGDWHSNDVSYTKHPDFSHWPCSVLGKEKDDLYTVRIHQSPFHADTKWHKQGWPRILTGYHRRAIHYFVKSSDQHLPGVFRHSIGIADDMFPEKWKDLR